MKIAIHDREGSFSDRWIEHCQQKEINYKIVNCYDSDIMQQISDCDALMWHHSHVFYKDVIFAKHLLYSVQASGKKVFPDFNTTWHFDDKVGQKYLLESIGAPLVSSYVFYTKKEALVWIDKTTFPKVFKLRRGAGATNVKLIKSKSEACKLVKRAFGKGLSQFNKWNNLSERIRRFKEGKENITGIVKGIGRLFIPTEFAKMYPREKGYAYFQDFIPNNNTDTRVVVIGNRAMAEKRHVRKNDFRASGSGTYSYEDINIEAIKIAFSVSKTLKLQSAAYDFIFDKNDNPLIIEVSYGFGTKGIKEAPGFWTDDLEWHSGTVKPEEWILEDILKS